VKVRVCKIQRVVAAFAFSAGSILSLAEKQLSEPQGEALFSDTARAVKKETRRKGAGLQASSQTFLEIFVPVEARKRHGVIWHVS